MPSPFIAWSDKRGALLRFKMTRGGALPALPDARVSKALIAAVGSSHDISFHAMSLLFNGNSSVLSALRQLNPGVGLGSAPTVARLVGEGIERVFEKVIKPALRDAVDKKLPLAMLADESPTPSGTALLLHLFAASMKEPIVIDIKVLGKAANSSMLLSETKAMMTGPGFLSEEEYAEHVKILTGDHAAYVIKAARDGKLDFSGDPAHAFDLNIKVVLAASKLKALFMLLRKVLNSHSYVMIRACEAFGIPPSISKMPATRWGYWGKLVRFLSDSPSVARLQQMLAWLFVHHYGGKEDELGDQVANAPWIDGVNFGPVDADVEGDEHAAAAELGDHGKAKWGAAGAGHEIGGDDSGDDDSDGDEGSPATVDARRQREIAMVLRALSDPRVLSQIYAVGLVIEPLRKMQVVAQKNDGLSPDVLASMNSAYLSLEQCVQSAASFNARIEPAFASINSSVGVAADTFALNVNVTRSADGTLVVENISDIKTPSLLDACPDIEAVAKMKKDVLDATRPSILGCISQYMKYCAAGFEIAQRRDAASGNVDFKTISFLALPKKKNAFATAMPPNLRDGVALLDVVEDEDDDFAGMEPLGGNEDASANKINGEWLLFLSVYENTASKFCFKKRVGTVCDYWLLVREAYPNVATVMLWWLSFPVGSAGLERDFSGLTMVTRAFRRRRLKAKNFRYSALSHCFKDDLDVMLKEHVRS